uniref:Uncharacterized protein n=1 Tax=Glossina brevipalpis TaxID=37001 RepID=A0A1A9W0R6_9MUSC
MCVPRSKNKAPVNKPWETGTTSEFASELTLHVLDIIIAKSFNATTHENDLVILRLNSNLPLGLRNDLKWAFLDDIDNVDKPCLVNFYLRNNYHSDPQDQLELCLELELKLNL